MSNLTDRRHDLVVCAWADGGPARLPPDLACCRALFGCNIVPVLTAGLLYQSLGFTVRSPSRILDVTQGMLDKARCTVVTGPLGRQ